VKERAHGPVRLNLLLDRLNNMTVNIIYKPCFPELSIMPKTDEGAALGHASFWDERYSKAEDSSKPTHEWFRDFGSLEPFFDKHLFTARKPDTRPRILHLGSGDSVSLKKKHV
jgi:hypothetical protein